MGLISRIESHGEVLNLGLDNVNIQARAKDIGGICGENDSGTIESCYVTGQISADEYNGCIGGICGMAYGIIKNCYSTATVIGMCNSVGGICGATSVSSYASTENCYFMGLAKLTDGSEGCMISTRSKNCYYLKDNGTDPYATPLTATMMRSASSFTGFDFPDTWFIDSDYSYPFPQLVNCPQRRVMSISMKSLPDKTSYLATDGRIDVTGGEISVIYDDGGSKDIPLTDSMVSYTFSVGAQSVKVNYAGKETSFTVSIEKDEPTFKGETEYTVYVDESFNLDITSNSTGEITYEYDESAGIIMLNGQSGIALKAGTATIKAVVAETDYYKNGEKMITVIVKEGLRPTPTPTPTATPTPTLIPTMTPTPTPTLTPKPTPTPLPVTPNKVISVGKKATLKANKKIVSFDVTDRSVVKVTPKGKKLKVQGLKRGTVAVTAYNKKGQIIKYWIVKVQ